MRDERLEHGPAPVPVNVVAGRPVEVEEALHIFGSQSIPSTLRAEARGGASAPELGYPEKYLRKPVGVRYQSRPWRVDELPGAGGARATRRRGAPPALEAVDEHPGKQGAVLVRQRLAQPVASSPSWPRAEALVVAARCSFGARPRASI